MCCSEPELPTVLKSQYIHSFRNVGLVRQKVTLGKHGLHMEKRGTILLAANGSTLGKYTEGTLPPKMTEDQKAIKFIGQHHFPGNTMVDFQVRN
jgi:hypothetical protein